MLEGMSLASRAAVAALALVGAAGCQCNDPPIPAARAQPSARAPRAASTSPEGLAWAIARLAPLHVRVRPAGPGDWLAEHDEPGQTFDQYRAADPIRPEVGERVGARHKLYIGPLGPLSATQRTIVELAGDYMQRFFGLEVDIQPALTLDVVPPEARRINGGTEQILTAHVLDQVLTPRLPADAAAYISFTASDLWPGAGYNFVFGQASLRDRVGVWSIHRNGDPDASPAAFRLALLRTLKTAVHETGHMFSMEHCTAHACVMNGANNLSESDRHPLWLCPHCMAKLSWSAQVDPVTRFGRLAEFCEQHGLEREAEFFRRSIKALW
jgi:archaemetzincin